MLLDSLFGNSFGAIKGYGLIEVKGGIEVMKVMVLSC